MTMPARNAGSSPVDMTMKMFSELLRVSSAAGYRVLPVSPMATAASSEMTHQMVAIRLDFFSSEDLLMAMNLKSTWGMPK